MRLVVSAPTRRPVVWKVTKIENTKPFGIQKLTLYQGFWDDHTDYIERDEEGHVIGMYADYFSSAIDPVEVPISETMNTKYKVDINASSYIIKVGGSYKLLKLSIIDDSNFDMTDSFENATFDWKCFIGDEDLTDIVTWLDQDKFNNKKIKFPNDRTYLGQTLRIECNITLNETKLSTSCDFELTI